ncbi:protein phosphatase 2C domain-containing protein [Actinoallomurus spadix]|uniref:Protein phosphatase 2C domain-containing protein n=1 Tax=Actinoallomurus spadix TaxID=79912 RepID=A0ABN0WWH5_9ACTN|nr:PP2C family serine/threonine-protein phosphatase [Actinoallomurus spadix]MCO5986656.1 protein phosphatase 2C domain-containing protein [Actinoallomurus spadix]
MTIGIHFAARSDVGMLREGNEDSAYAGSRLLAVADGMGGHVGGEIASAAAIETLKPLDRDFPAHELVGALEQAVHRANETLHSIVEGDPSLQGMGCTLTAMLWNGPQVALVHIGDSRAYLLRNGELFQITHDHTLVQSLVDEGRITLDEAASHPQRSLLLRALDGRGEVDPDIALREAQLGDRYLLCSDGLSTVVSAETIHHALSTAAEPDQAVRQLIDLANRGGGPDNITCVVADVVELEQLHGPPSAPITAGAAHNASLGRGEADMPPGAMAAETPAQRAAALREQQHPAPVTVADIPAVGRQPAEETLPQEALPQEAVGRRRRRWPWLVAAAGAVVVLAAGGGYVAYNTIQGQYYVAADGGQVVIYQGMNQDLLGIKLYHLKERPSPALKVADLAPSARDSVNHTIDGLGSLSKARTTVHTLRGQVCRVVVADNSEGVVTIWKGKGQKSSLGCDETVVEKPSPPVQASSLPKATKDTVHKGIIVADVTQARAKVQELRDAADTCRRKPGKSGCPPVKANTTHP